MGNHPRASRSLRQHAIDYLARREHSRYELQRKLVSKGWELAQVKATIEELAADHLQSDDRFISSYIRHRIDAGYGPRRIQLELAERGIRTTSDSMADENDMEWLPVLERIWQKKFAGEHIRDLQSKAKQIRFLLQRGFAPEQVYNFCRSKTESPGE